MKKLLLSMLLLTSTAHAENMYLWDVIKVIDGDTVKFKVDFLPRDLKPQLNVRINGIDTPEKAPRAKCEDEAQLANKATEFTKDKIKNAKTITVSIKDWDKYGGRILGEIFVDEKPLSKLLIDNGLAREYNGGTKASWCDF